MNTPTNLINSLRALVPRQRLHYREAQRIAELQANRFRELLNIAEPELPESAIARLPRIRVRRRHGLPVSGLTHWHNGQWLIILNADEPEQRQRFSLAHEFFHVLSHTTLASLAWDEPKHSASAKAEHLADYFAGCLLMPKMHVKRLWGTQQSAEALADAFGVSVAAMKVRLSQLRLIDPVPRCLRPTARWGHFGSIYFRTKSPPGAAA